MRRDFAFVALMGIACLFIFYFYHSHRSDDALITARYAYRLGRGDGLVYNPGDRVQGFTSPLQVLYLGAVSFFAQNRAWLPFLQNLISVGFLFGMGVLLYRIAAPVHGRLFAVCLVGIACSPGIILNTIGFETLTYGFFCLLAIHLFTGRKYRPAFLMLALATLTRFDCVLLFALMAFFYLIEFRGKQAPHSPFWIYAIPVGLWLAFAWYYFGSPLPNTLTAKMIQGRSGVAFWDSSLIGALRQQFNFFPLASWWIFLVPGFLLLKSRIKNSPLLIVLLWGAGHSLLYFGILKVPSIYFWYHAPTLLAWFIVLACGSCAQGECDRSWRNGRERDHGGDGRGLGYWAARGMTGLFLLAILWQSVGDHRKQLAVEGSYRYPIYRSIAEWLNANTAPEHSVAAFEIGVLGYYCNNRMIDLCNLVNRDQSIPTSQADYLIIEKWLLRENQSYIDRNYMHVQDFRMDGFPVFYCYKKRDFP
jgi:hypothetical protein